MKLNPKIGLLLLALFLVLYGVATIGEGVVLMQQMGGGIIVVGRGVLGLLAGVLIAFNK